MYIEHCAVLGIQEKMKFTKILVAIMAYSHCMGTGTEWIQGTELAH